MANDINPVTPYFNGAPVSSDNKLPVDAAFSGGATEAKQDAQITVLNTLATQVTLAAILAKIIAAPATEAKQDVLNAKDFATQATLAAVLAKIIAAPATEAKQDAGNASLASILSAVGGALAAFYPGQKAVTGSAAAIAASQALSNGVVVTARLENTGSVWVGGSGVTVTDNGTGNGYRLSPGQSVAIAVNNLASVYVIGPGTSEIVYFVGN